MNRQIVLTGIRESRAITCLKPLQKVLNPQLLLTTDEKQEKVERWLVFNDGALEIPCGQELFDYIVRYLSQNPPAGESGPEAKPRRRAVLPNVSSEIPEGAEVFSASDEIPPPPPPEEESEDDQGDDTDWAGEPDDAEDGVGQL